MSAIVRTFDDVKSTKNATMTVYGTESLWYTPVSSFAVASAFDVATNGGQSLLCSGIQSTRGKGYDIDFTALRLPWQSSENRHTGVFKGFCVAALLIRAQWVLLDLMIGLFKHYGQYW